MASKTSSKTDSQHQHQHRNTSDPRTYSRQISLPHRVYAVISRLSDVTGHSKTHLVRTMMRLYFEHHPEHAKAVDWSPELIARRTRKSTKVVIDRDGSSQQSSTTTKTGGRSK